MNTKDAVSDSEQVDDHHGQKRLYALTWDLGEKMQRFSTIGLKVPGPNASIFVEATNSLINELNAILSPVAEVFARSTQELAGSIMAKVANFRSELLLRTMRESLVISTCPEIANLRDGLSLNINRLISEDDELIGLGPRPGTQGLHEQFEHIFSVADGRSVILIEDGAFTGSTMSFILKKMMEHRIHVAAVVIGIAFSKAREKIAKVFDGEIICEEERDWFDWMPDHDFYPFSPNSGRVFGVMWRENAIPLYTKDGFTLSAPYILPFAPVGKWASIPQKDFLGFSRSCLNRTLRIFQNICKVNDSSQLTIGDLAGVVPRVSIPMPKGQKHVPSLNTRVLDYLKDCIDDTDYEIGILKRARFCKSGLYFIF